MKNKEEIAIMGVKKVKKIGSQRASDEIFFEIRHLEVRYNNGKLYKYFKIHNGRIDNVRIDDPDKFSDRLK